MYGKKMRILIFFFIFCVLFVSFANAGVIFEELDETGIAELNNLRKSYNIMKWCMNILFVANLVLFIVNVKKIEIGKVRIVLIGIAIIDWLVKYWVTNMDTMQVAVRSIFSKRIQILIPLIAIQIFILIYNIVQTIKIKKDKKIQKEKI